MLLLRAVIIVCHLKHPSGWESLQLPVQLKRLLSSGRIRSMSYHCLDVGVITFNNAEQRIEKQWGTDSRLWRTPINRACYSNHTRKINPPTCILTAIDREFSSLSSSLRTTSFFSVRLQSLEDRTKHTTVLRKRNRNDNTNTISRHYRKKNNMAQCCNILFVVMPLCFLRSAGTTAS